MNKNIIIISINRKMPIKILTSNNRIIIKENFVLSGGGRPSMIVKSLSPCPPKNMNLAGGSN